MFICSDSWLEAAGGIDLSLCLVCLRAGICPDTPPLAGPTLVHLRSVFTHSSFPSFRPSLCSDLVSCSAGSLGGTFFRSSRSLPSDLR